MAQVTRRFFCQLLGASLATPAFAQSDWFEALDQEFEQTFAETDQAFDRAMREGVAKLDRELADLWDAKHRLPEPKVWVGYLDARKTRVIVDYDKGTLSVESQDQDEKALRKTFDRILNVPEDQWQESDLLKDRLIEATKPLKNVSRTPLTPPPRPKAQAERAEGIRLKNFSDLVEPEAKPQFVRRENILTSGRAPRPYQRITVPLKPEPERDRLSAQALRDPVEQAARKYDLPRALILSVIKNESAFNPRARSHANALGLMQLVPTSGGKDAYAYVSGRDDIPSPELLYDPEQNIFLGSTYLHILKTRYFDKVTDAKTQQYMMIAAYNTGAGNVAKAFVGTMKVSRAVTKANQMTSAEVYEHLIKHLPYAETRTYLAKVARDTQTFAHWDQAFWPAPLYLQKEFFS